MIASAEEASFSIRGTVVDSMSGKGVELATIAIKVPGNDQIITGTTTDVDGKFVIPNVKAGKYELAILFIGYNSKNIQIEVNRDLLLGVITLSS